MLRVAKSKPGLNSICYPKRPKNRKGWNLNGCVPCVGEYWRTLGNESTGKMLFLLEGEIVCLFYCCCVFFFFAKTLSLSLLLNFKIGYQCQFNLQANERLWEGKLANPIPLIILCTTKI